MKEMNSLTALRGMKKVIVAQTLTYFLLVAVIEFGLFYPDLSERYDLPCQILFTTALAGFAGHSLQLYRLPGAQRPPLSFWQGKVATLS